MFSERSIQLQIRLKRRCLPHCSQVLLRGCIQFPHEPLVWVIFCVKMQVVVNVLFD